MWLDINPRASEPIYLQIIRGVKSAVAKGLLQPGEKLPSVRELATELTVNHNTVARAYQELERECIIDVIVGRGTFISLNPVPPNYEQRVAELRDSLKTFLIEAHHLGFSEHEFLELVHEVVRNWRGDEEVPSHEK